MSNPSFPFGPVDWQSITGTGTQAVTVSTSDTVLYCSGLTGAITINLTIDASLDRGARMRIIVVQGATGRNVTLGTGFITNGAADLTGVASDIDVIELIYDGTQFLSTQTWQKTYDAA